MLSDGVSYVLRKVPDFGQVTADFGMVNPKHLRLGVNKTCCLHLLVYDPAVFSGIVVQEVQDSDIVQKTSNEGLLG